jgi:hypothetical protein
MFVKAFLSSRIEDPYKQPLQEVIRNPVESYSRSAQISCLGLMHMTREMYRGVTHIERVEVPEEFSNETFIRHLMLGTGETSRRNERAHDVQENDTEFRFNGTRYKYDGDIHTYGAI